MAENIPVVDFSALSLDVTDADIDESSLISLSDRLIQVFSTVGFVYLSNTGVPKDEIQDAFKISKRFFELPASVKEQCKMKEGETVGWVAPEKESTSAGVRPGDLKEAFSLSLRNTSRNYWPQGLPEFESDMLRFYATCMRLAYRVLLAIAVGLKLEDREFFIKCHYSTKCKPEHINMVLKTSYYPAIGDEVKIKDNQARLGEHTDFGTATLLFQDNAGGLQVQGIKGDWIDATPIEDTVIVNIADLLQRWTSDHLKSTPHRVLIPEDESIRKRARQSLVFFAYPDATTKVVCFNGSNKYPETDALEYLNQKMSAIRY